MAKTRITKIELKIHTADVSGAGTDGSVYLGIAGREFVPDTNMDDFERGQERIYKFGEKPPTVKAADLNDPAAQKLYVEDLASFPAYIRFEPNDASDAWCVEGAHVIVNGKLAYDASIIGGHDPDKYQIWLGKKYGKMVYLTKV